MKSSFRYRIMPGATIHNDNTSVTNVCDPNNIETTFINQKLKDLQEQPIKLR